MPSMAAELQEKSIDGVLVTDPQTIKCMLGLCTGTTGLANGKWGISQGRPEAVRFRQEPTGKGAHNTIITLVY
jgi:hypothetical protein